MRALAPNQAAKARDVFRDDAEDRGWVVEKLLSYRAVQFECDAFLAPFHQLTGSIRKYTFAADDDLLAERTERAADCVHLGGASLF